MNGTGVLRAGSASRAERHDRWGGRARRREKFGQALTRYGQVVLIDDVVAAERARRLPAPNTHDDAFIDSRLPKVAGTAAPEIVEEELGQPDGLGRRQPGGPEVSDRTAAAVKYVRTL